jgi:hypothetical protein
MAFQPLLQLRLDCFDFGGFLGVANIDCLLASANVLDVWHVGVLLAHEDGIDLLESCALGLDPKDNLTVVRSCAIMTKMREAYNEDQSNDIPATVDEVHLPGDVRQGDRDTVHQYDSENMVLVKINDRIERLLTQGLAGQDELQPDHWLESRNA